MAYTLIGTRYIGTGALPTAVAGYDAVDTSTGNQYAANSTATAWNLIGNTNQVNLGLAAITGFTATGAIAGATGWAPMDSPNFTSSAKLGGIDLATTDQLATTSTSILASIAPKITEAIASLSTSVTVKGSIAVASGILTFANNTAQTIPLPTYPDGTTAAEVDCKWSVGLVAGGWPCGRSDSNGNTNLYKSANPTTTRTFAIYLKDDGGTYYSASVAYFIIGIKS